MALYPLFVQSLAVVAVLFFLVSFHALTREKILGLQLAGLAIWIVHFLLIGAYTGALLLALNAVITTVLLYKTTVRPFAHPLTLYLCLVSLFIGTLFTWTGWYSLFAFLGVGIGVVAKWQHHPHHLRIIVIFSSIAWIVYDVFAGSIGSIISECLMIGSVALSLVWARKF